MISWLGLLLVGGAVAVAASGVVSVAGAVLARGVSRLSPTRRADLLLALGLAPLLAVGLTAAAVFGPSVLDAVGLRSDHCALHDHHAHICAVHGDLPPAWLAAIGAVAWAVIGSRLVWTAASLLRSNRALNALRRLGRTSGDDPTRIEVPGSPWICVATGVVRRRVIVSSSLRERLTPTSWHAALAHERAHLRRQDPLVGTVLSLALTATWPGFSSALLARWREASEFAADARAARETTPLAVAEALVSVARLGPSHELRPALAADALERRVIALLGDVPSPGHARPGAAAGASLAVALLLALATGDALHHALESTLAALR